MRFRRSIWRATIASVRSSLSGDGGCAPDCTTSDGHLQRRERVAKIMGDAAEEGETIALLASQAIGQVVERDGHLAELPCTAGDSPHVSPRRSRSARLPGGDKQGPLDKHVHPGHCEREAEKQQDSHRDSEDVRDRVPLAGRGLGTAHRPIVRRDQVLEVVERSGLPMGSTAR